MAILCSYFDHVKYPASEYINRDKDFVGNGVLTPATDFALTYPATPNMTVNIGAGVAWVNGLRIGYDANPIQTLTFQAADPTNPRIDLIEVGYTGSGLQGVGIIKVVQGTPAASPLQPQPDIGFIGLYAVRINANVTSITSASVTDLRAGITLAGASNVQLASVVPGTLAFGSTGVVGISSAVARADHVHPMPSVATVATSGKYSDLTGTPTISTDGTFANPSDSVLSSQKAIATLVNSKTPSLATASEAGTVQVADVPASGNPIVATRVASASESLLTTTGATAVVSYTPAAQGNFLIATSLRVTTATTNITVTVTWTDASGAQTNTQLNIQALTVGTHALPILMINAKSTGVISVNVTAGTANQVYASTTILGV